MKNPLLDPLVLIPAFCFGAGFLVHAGRVIGWRRASAWLAVLVIAGWCVVSWEPLSRWPWEDWTIRGVCWIAAAVLLLPVLLVIPVLAWQTGNQMARGFINLRNRLNG